VLGFPGSFRLAMRGPSSRTNYPDRASPAPSTRCAYPSPSNRAKIPVMDVGVPHALVDIRLRSQSAGWGTR
jgi:hypothetical protein